MHSKHLKISIFFLMPAVLILLVFPGRLLSNEEFKESDHAKGLFIKSLGYLIGTRETPTWQGKRNVVITGPDGMMRKFSIFDGYSRKFGGYHARIEDKLMPPKNAMGSPPGGMGGPPPGGPGGPPPGGPGGPGPGGRGRGKPPGGPPPGRGPNPGQPGDQQPPGSGMGDWGPPPGPPPGGDDEFLRQLADYNRPDMSPVLGGQKMIAKRLEKNNDHLIIKGPLSDTVSGRKTWVIEISPRNYSGASLRIWLDQDTLIPLKKQRIGTKGNLTYTSEYAEFKLVDDKNFAFKEEPRQPGPGELFNPGGDFDRPIPPGLMNREMFINQQVIIPRGAEGFKLASMRKLPFIKLPGVHYVFSDGLNTLSVFHFYNPGKQPEKKVYEFVKILSKKLETALGETVLCRREKGNIFIVTADMSFEDLKKISKNIALQSIDKIKDRRDRGNPGQHQEP